ncbi:DUF4399 domain-containing protein [Halomarina ordinaria]|uniref:DUF4399 domain-containing protein n=1 Tax=Halomarina ordinaria TaxID=3033939 RepID=A0ABD5UJ91_9EURY|nr:DUF4399 domain-containing protein [Halomarina sp. PSRA2]
MGQSRRRYLTLLGTVGLGTLAGCSGVDDGTSGGNGSADDGETPAENASSGSGSAGASDAPGENGSDANETGNETTPEEPPVARYDEAASVSFVLPNDGGTAHTSPTVLVDASGFAVEAAGERVDGEGHLHLLVDADPVPAGEPMPEDDAHVHLDDGSVETVLDLDEGDHELVAQVADGTERATDITDRVSLVVANDATVTVETPPDGAYLGRRVGVEWAVSEGVSLAPAGGLAPNTGYAHLLVDADAVPVGDPMPDGEDVYPADDGGTRRTVDLSPGEHELRVQVSNGHGLATALTDSVTVSVD